jgi:signal peptidase I
VWRIVAPFDRLPRQTYHRAGEGNPPFVGSWLGLGALATAAAIVALAAWFRPTRVEVAGASMEPTLRAGDWALAVRVPRRRLRPGLVVVARPPARPGLEVVKRVVAGPGDVALDVRVLGPDEWFLAGDRPEASTDSRGFGTVPSSAIVGRVVLVYWPPDRRRVVR